MRAICLGICFGLSLHLGGAAEILRELDWHSVAENQQLETGRLLTVGGDTVLEISNTNSRLLSARVLTVEHPPVSKRAYAVTGLVRCEGVRSNGYLEMWNYFAPAQPGGAEAAYFSRTLAQSGEMGRLSGSSAWRKFLLPFDSTGTTGGPVRLVVNVVLPLQGTVQLKDLRLVQTSDGISSLFAPTVGAWWSDAIGGWIGGIAGASLGCFASLLAWLAARGIFRAFVLSSLWLLIGLGFLLTMLGIFAVSSHQPYGVWFVLLLLGGLLLSIIPFRLAQCRRLYNTLELRKMTSLDAMGG